MPDFSLIVFCGFAFMLLTAALGVVLARNPVHASLFLVLAFLASGGVWMLLHAEFLALLIVLVYVGAVMVLFLFVVMMLDINLEVLREGFWRYLPLAAFAALLVAGEMIYALQAAPLLGESFSAPPPPPDDNARALAGLLYTDYAYPLELAATMLLAAIVAAVALTLRRRKDIRHVDPAFQTAAKRSERVRLVNLPLSQPPSAEPSAHEESSASDFQQPSTKKEGGN